MRKRSLLTVLIISLLVMSLQGIVFAETITYMTPESDPTAVETDKKIIERFEEEHPGVEVELSHADLEDLLPKLSMMLQAGTAPDVGHISPMYVPPLVEQGHIVPLEDLFEEIGDIPKRFVTPTEDGTIYDIPKAIESRPLYYRKDLMEEAGVEPPETFEELIEVAKALTVDKDDDGNIDQYGITLRGKGPGNVYAFVPFLWSNGGDLLDEEGNIAINSPEAVEALKTWGELANYCPPGISNTSYHDMIANFAQGNAAMIVAPGRMMANIDRYKPELRSKVDIKVMPVGPSGDTPVNWTPINNMAVFDGDNVELGKEFLKFYLKDKQYFEFLTAAVPGHALPTRESWLEKEMYYEEESIERWEPIVKKSLSLAFDYGVDYMPRYDGNEFVGRFMSDPTFSRELSKYLSGEVSAEEALDNVAEAWQEMME